MAYAFKILSDVAIPQTVRGGGGRSLGFPFGDLKVGKVGEAVKGDTGFYIPREFWVSEAKLKDSDLGSDKGTGSASDLKDRVRRSFYGWRDADEKRANLTLVFVDDWGTDPANKKYAGVNVYLTTSNAAEAATKPADNKKDTTTKKKAA